ncbi:hypothetical protein ACSTJG_25085, partial [Vibrio parahaemolyticus]
LIDKMSASGEERVRVITPSRSTIPNFKLVDFDRFLDVLLGLTLQSVLNSKIKGSDLKIQNTLAFESEPLLLEFNTD